MMKSIHDRMPCILEKDKEDSWLNPEANENYAFLEHLLTQYNPKKMASYQVSTDVNKTTNNYQELTIPVA